MFDGINPIALRRPTVYINFWKSGCFESSRKLFSHLHASLTFSNVTAPLNDLTNNKGMDRPAALSKLNELSSYSYSSDSFPTKSMTEGTLESCN